MAQEIKKSEGLTTTPAPRSSDPALRAEMDHVFNSFLGRRWISLSRAGWGEC